MHQYQAPRTSFLLGATSQRYISTFEKVDINTNLTELDLAKEEESELVDNPWTMLPFKKESKMELPVYDLVTGDFTGEICGKYYYFPSFVYC